jgi:hypothetical protein
MATLKRLLVRPGMFDIREHPAVKELDARMAEIAQQLIQPAGRSRAAPVPKQDGAGRPSGRDERLAFIDSETPADQEPTPRTRKLAREKFRITERTLRRDLEYRRGRRTK